MKIGIYSPYIDTFGGGERYAFSLASHWSARHTVSVFWDDKQVLEEAQNRFDVDLSSVGIVPNIFKSSYLLYKLYMTGRYDCIFFVSDGSVPTSYAKRNILHFQVPFAHVSLPRWKASRYQRIICNSEFTKDHLDQSVHIARTVIYPPVDIEKIKAVSKDKIILSVGRFSSLYGAKKQNVLIDAFRKATSQNLLSGWKLLLAGGLLPSDRKYFDDLKMQAKGVPVEFYPNCSFTKLMSLYGSSSIYWHAAGFGETKPELMEHFGITTVEAMAGGCVPVVYSGGGQTEIVTEGESGELWKSPSELILKTMAILNDASVCNRLSKGALKKAKDFSKERFTRSFDQLLSEL